MQFVLSKNFLKIIGLFLTWRLLLIICMFIAINFIPLGSTDRFLGGGPGAYQILPSFFGWANFDGEHYLSIAIFGYKPLEQAFFPIYPGLISIFARIVSTDLFSAIFSSIFIGLVISHLAFLLALVLLWELIRLDFSEKIAILTLILLLIFPTSFYFGALYSESLFLLLVVASFYSARKNHWFLSGFLGMIASASRVFGILLLPALLIEAWQQKISFKKAVRLMLIPIGLLCYMFYQWLFSGDPLSFYHLQTLVGEQHQAGLVLLPQVFFRYFKMFLSVAPSNPIYQTIILEFLTGLLFFFLPIYGYFKKIRLSYLFFAMFGFLLPTIQGSFSSLPRYVIVLFPSFLALAIFLNNRPKSIRLAFILLSILGLAVETMLFLRGYWVA